MIGDLLPHARMVLDLVCMVGALSSSSQCDPKNDVRVDFQTLSSFTLSACVAREPYMGYQIALYTIRNNMQARQEVEFEKEYHFSCGKTQTTTAHMELKPGEVRVGWFGDADLFDGPFPGDVCGTKARISGIRIRNQRAINLDHEEYLKREKEKLEAAQRERERREEEAREAARRVAEAEQERRKVEAARRESEREAEQQRQRAEAERREREREAAEQRKRAAISRQLDYIQELQRQQQAAADRSHATFQAESDRRIAGLSSDLERNSAQLEAERAASAERTAEIDGRIAAHRQALADGERRLRDAQRDVESAVDDVLSALDAEPAAQPPSSVEGVTSDGSNVRYSGAWAADVRRLLARSPTPWQTPSCKSCTDGVPPQLPEGMPCVRDKHVFAALQYAWAAESYTRVGDAARASSSATSMHTELVNASSLCSETPGIAGAPRCATLAVWPCP